MSIPSDVSSEKRALYEHYQQELERLKSRPKHERTESDTIVQQSLQDRLAKLSSEYARSLKGRGSPIPFSQGSSSEASSRREKDEE